MSYLPDSGRARMMPSIKPIGSEHGIHRSHSRQSDLTRMRSSNAGSSGSDGIGSTIGRQPLQIDEAGRSWRTPVMMASPISSRLHPTRVMAASCVRFSYRKDCAEAERAARRIRSETTILARRTCTPTRRQSSPSSRVYRPPGPGRCRCPGSVSPRWLLLLVKGWASLRHDLYYTPQRGGRAARWRQPA